MRRVVEPMLSGGEAAPRRGRPAIRTRSRPAGGGRAAADGKSDLRRGGAERARLRAARQSGRGCGVVRGRERPLGHGKAADGVRRFLRRTRRPLAGPLRLPGGGAAVDSAGLSATHRQRRRAHRARVRPRPAAHGSAGNVAARDGAAFGPVGANRDRMQGAARHGAPGARWRGARRPIADARVHGQVRCRRGPSGGVRPSRRGQRPQPGGGRARTPPRHALGGPSGRSSAPPSQQDTGSFRNGPSCRPAAGSNRRRPKPRSSNRSALRAPP